MNGDRGSGIASMRIGIVIIHHSCHISTLLLADQIAISSLRFACQKMLVPLGLYGLADLATGYIKIYKSPYLLQRTDSTNHTQAL